MSNSLLRGLAALLLLTAVAAPASADPDLKAIEAYKLTSDGIEKYMQANRNMVKAVEADPTLKAKLEKEDEAQGAGELSLAQLTAGFDRHAALKKAIGDTGLSTREFATVTLVLFQVGFADMGMSQGGKLPEGVSRSNLETYRANKAKIEKFGAEMQAAEERSGAGASN